MILFKNIFSSAKKQNLFFGFLLCLSVNVVNSAGEPLAGLSLDLTLGTDVSANACGTENIMTIDPGEPINYCYTITNTGSTTFERYSIDSNVFRNIAGLTDLTLAPGETFQFNDIRVSSSSFDLTAQWTGSEGQSHELLTLDDVDGPAYDFTDISTTGTALNLSDDDSSSVMLDFPFEMIGQSSTNINISNNGVVRFAADVEGDFTEFTNQDLTMIDEINYIAPFWDDINDTTGNIYHETIGMTPDRIFIVQWDNRDHINSNVEGEIDTVSFQVKLFETSNEIQFHYKDVSFGDVNLDSGASSTVGIGGGVQANQFSFNTASLSDSFAISFNLIGENSLVESTTVSGSAQIIINSADINIPQTAIVVQQDVPSVLLPLENLGTYTLNWSTSEGAVSSRSVGEYAKPNDKIKLNSDDYFSPKFPEFSSFTDNNVKTSQNFSNNGSDTIVAYYLELFTSSLNKFILPNPNFTSTISTLAEYQNTYAADFFGNNFDELYILQNNQNNGPSVANNLASINTLTGDYNSIGTTNTNSADEVWVGMTWDPETNTLFALSLQLSNSTTGDSLLYTVNVSTGEVSYIATITGKILIDIAADIDGNLYTIDSISDQLYYIDKTTGAVTLIGPTNYDTGIIGGLDFDFNTNILYWMSCEDTQDFSNISDCGDLKSIDLAIGNATSLGQIGGSGLPLSFNFAIASENICDDEVSWLSISETSGSIAPGSSTNLEVNFDTNGLSDGEYKANICIRSNDPDEPIKVVSVNLNVDEVIFDNGFETVPVN